MVKKNGIQTSAKIASRSGNILRKNMSSKDTMSLAGSALSNSADNTIRKTKVTRKQK